MFFKRKRIHNFFEENEFIILHIQLLHINQENKIRCILQVCCSSAINVIIVMEKL